MKRLNPLYIILLFLVVVLISFFKLAEYKKSYKEELGSLNEVKIKIKDYNNLTSTWKNEQYATKILNQLSNNRVFKSAKISKSKNKRFISFKIESKNPRILDNFLNKILNKKLVIEKLELQKEFIDLQVGIK